MLRILPNPKRIPFTADRLETSTQARLNGQLPSIMRVPWLAVFEVSPRSLGQGVGDGSMLTNSHRQAWAVNNLIRSTGFNGFVRNVHKTFHKLRHGTPMEEMGGTNIDKPAEQSFLKHFTEELRAQLRGETKKKP